MQKAIAHDVNLHWRCHCGHENHHTWCSDGGHTYYFICDGCSAEYQVDPPNSENKERSVLKEAMDLHTRIPGPQGSQIAESVQELEESAQQLKTILISANNARVEICPHFYTERVPVNEEETSFEIMSCCKVSGKLHHVKPL